MTNPCDKNEYFEAAGYGQRHRFYFRLLRGNSRLIGFKNDHLTHERTLSILAPLDFWERHYIHSDGGRLERPRIRSDLVDACFRAGERGKISATSEHGRRQVSHRPNVIAKRAREREQAEQAAQKQSAPE